MNFHTSAVQNRIRSKSARVLRIHVVSTRSVGRVLLSRSSVATPALFRFAGTRRRWVVLPNATFYNPDNGGCSQATAWMLRLIGSSPGRRAFPPFFLSSMKGDRRRGAEDVERPRRHPPPSLLRREKNPPFPSPCRNNRYTHTVARLRTCTRERSHVHPRMLRAFVTFYYWQSARYNRAYSPDRALRR